MLAPKQHSEPITDKVSVETWIWDSKEQTRLFNFTRMEEKMSDKYDCVGSHTVVKFGPDNVEFVEATMANQCPDPSNNFSKLFNLIYHESQYYITHPNNHKSLQDNVKVSTSIDN
jgi:hypothetical protein